MQSQLSNSTDQICLLEYWGFRVVSAFIFLALYVDPYHINNRETSTAIYYVPVVVRGSLVVICVTWDVVALIVATTQL